MTDIVIRSRDQILPSIVNAPIFSGDFPKGGYTVTITRNDATATQKQINAHWVWCDWQASILNDSGLTRQVWFNIPHKKLEFIWTKENVHDDIFLPVLLAMTDGNTKSSKDMLTTAPTEILNALALVFGKYGAEVAPWPSRR